MASIIQFRRDSSTAWGVSNPILAQGEMGLETDTFKFKFGDGVLHWNLLPYFYTNLGILIAIRKTAAQWTALNPTLTLGELGIETDTNKTKIGDGVTAWNSQLYMYEQPNIQIYRGTALLDFGSTPTDEASVVVTGLTSMTATANIQVFTVGDDTTVSNTAADHDGFSYMAILQAGARVAGTGFTITGRAWNGFLTGIFKVHYHYTV